MPIDTSELIGDIPTYENGEIDYPALETLLKEHPELRTYIVDRILPIITYGGKHYKTLITTNFVWEAKEIAQLLMDRGIKVGIGVNDQDARMAEAEGITALDAMERIALPEADPQSIQVLVSPYKAGEGFDVPEIEMLVAASPIGSELRYTQNIGRISRRANGKAYGLAIDCLFHRKKFGWSMNFGMWMRNDVRQLPSGMLYLGPLQDIKTFEDLQGMYKLGDSKSLESLQDERAPAPDGWLVMGTGSEDSNTICSLLGRSATWVRFHLPKAIKNIEDEYNKQNVPLDKREDFSRQYYTPRHQSATHYSPNISRELTTIAEEEAPPEDWLVIGTSKSVNTITSLYGRSRPWVEARIPKVIINIQSEWNEKRIPEEDREELSGTYKVKTGSLRGVFYSPLVWKRLDTITKAELRHTAIDETHFPFTDKSFIQIFRGGFKLGEGVLRKIADRVIAKVKIEYPDKIMITKSLNGTDMIESFTDRELFIQLMVEAGAKLKEPSD